MKMYFIFLILIELCVIFKNSTNCLLNFKGQFLKMTQFKTLYFSEFAEFSKLHYTTLQKLNEGGFRTPYRTYRIKWANHDTELCDTAFSR